MGLIGELVIMESTADRDVIGHLIKPIRNDIREQISKLIVIIAMFFLHSEHFKLRVKFTIFYELKI